MHRCWIGLFSGLLLKISFTALLFLSLNFTIQAQDSLNVVFPNGDSVVYAVEFKDRDSLNGVVKAVFSQDTSVVAYKGSFINGKPNGPFLFYYPSGTYRQTLIYGYGELHGDYTVYNDNGSVIKKGKFKNGVKHGYWIDVENKLIGRYYKGKRHLSWKIKNASGKGVKERWTYFNGVLKRGDPNSAELLDL